MAPLRVLDTTVLVDHLRGSSEARLFLAAFDEPPLASEMVRAEVIRGLRSRERAHAERLFGLIDWVPVGEAVARLAGEYGRRYRRSQQDIGLADLIVAATATELGTTPATANVRHFPMFPRLRSPY